MIGALGTAATSRVIFSSTAFFSGCGVVGYKSTGLTGSLI